jgi:hypothetical protein
MPGNCKPSILSHFGFGVCAPTHGASFVPSTCLCNVLGVIEDRAPLSRALAKISAPTPGQSAPHDEASVSNPQLCFAALVLLGAKTKDALLLVGIGEESRGCVFTLMKWLAARIKTSLCGLEHIQGRPTSSMLPLTLMPQSRNIQASLFYLKHDRVFARTAQAVCLTMLKRSSSLILALMLGSSVMAGTACFRNKPVCEMADMDAMPGMETMPCCNENQGASIAGESGSPEQCCINTPQETGSRGATFNLSPPCFSVAIMHPAVVQSPLAAPKPYECSYSAHVFLPNLQASYIRNLSILI